MRKKITDLLPVPFFIALLLFGVYNVYEVYITSKNSVDDVTRHHDKFEKERDEFINNNVLDSLIYLVDVMENIEKGIPSSLSDLTQEKLITDSIFYLTDSAVIITKNDSTDQTLVGYDIKDYARQRIYSSLKISDRLSLLKKTTNELPSIGNKSLKASISNDMELDSVNNKKKIQQLINSFLKRKKRKTIDSLIIEVENLNKELAKQEENQEIYEIKISEIVGKVEKTADEIAELYFQKSRTTGILDSILMKKKKDYGEHLAGLKKETREDLSVYFENLDKDFRSLGITLFALLVLCVLSLLFLVRNYYRNQKHIRSREDFLSNVCHEIKNTLHPIIGHASSLNRTSLNPKHKRPIGIIAEESQQLLTLANGILDLSKIRSSQFELDNKPFSLNMALEQIVTSFQILAKKKEVEINIIYPDHLPRIVMGDINRFKQIIVNLVSNSIKYTSNGKVSLQVERQYSSEGNLVFSFCIIDTGKGIENEKLKEIHKFKRFMQSDIIGEGHGLGLTITFQLIQKHGGSLEIKSKGINKGTEAWVYLPYEVLDIEEESIEIDVVPIKTQILSNKKILVIDDDIFNLDLAEGWLQNWGAKVNIAHNGIQGKNFCEENAFSYNLIIVDLNMPEMNGYEFIKWIRNTAKSDIPIVVSSAESVGSELERVINLGANNYLPKPYEDQDLWELLTEIFNIDTSGLIEFNPKKEEEGEPLVIKKLLAQVNGDEQKFLKRKELLIKRTEENLVIIKSSIEKKDFLRVQKYIHKTATICPLFGTELVELQKELNSELKNENPPKKVLDKLGSFVEKLETELMNLKTIDS